MMTNFPWDIVLLALLALLMVGTLFCVLGRRIGAQGLKQEPSPAGRTREAHRADDQTSPMQPPPLPNQSVPEESRTEYVIPEAHTPLSDKLATLAQKMPGFTAEGFLRQSEVFFGDVVSAFAKADMPSLKARLAPEAFEAFQSLIEERQKEGHQAFCDIKRVEQLEYKGVTSIAPNEEIGETGSILFEIAIISWQISNVRDGEKNIIDGTEALTEFHDVWGISCSPHGGDLKLVSTTVF